MSDFENYVIGQSGHSNDRETLIIVALCAILFELFENEILKFLTLT